MLETVMLLIFLLCVSFGSTEPFEELRVAVSAPAELGISGDFLCNFVVVLWCDLDRSL